MHLFLLLAFCPVICYGKQQYDEWIDPTDMLNYDAASGRMKNQKWQQVEDSEEPTKDTCQSDNSDCKADTNKWKPKDSIDGFPEKDGTGIKDESMCKEDMAVLRKELEEWRKKGEISQSSCNPVFRRFLYRIINEAKHLGLPDESQPEVHYDAELVLTKQMVAEFLRFLDDTDWNAGPLDEALGGTLVRFRQHNEEEWSWKFEDYIGTDPFSAFMICLSLLCIVMVVATELWTRISWFTQLRRLLVLCFLVSLVWNWLYLYRDAFAERQAKLTKIGNDHTCGKKISWSESLLEWWKGASSFQNDPCEEYFKALMVNPILLVPPTKAFAVTFTNFITEPLKHIGKGIGEFFHALLAEMPLFYQPIVLIIIALLLLVFCYGFGTTVHRINVLRGDRDRERGRLPPPNPQREGYDQFIEGVDNQPYNYPQAIQPQHVENHRDVLNGRPEVLHPVDCVDTSNGQQEFVEPVTASQQPQRKNVAPLQSKEDPLEQQYLSQQPVKEQLKNSVLGSQDKGQESLKDIEPLDKILPYQQESPVSCIEVIENVLPDGKTLVNTSQFTEEVKERKESTEEKDEQLNKEDESKDQIDKMENSCVNEITAAKQHDVAHGSRLHLPDLDVEDLYTDPENENSQILEEQEAFKDEMSLKQTTVS